MLEIIICEDDIQQNKAINTCISNFIMMEELDAKVTLAAHKPQEVLDYITENKTIGLYFLDVDLNNDIDGIRLAEQIRHYDPRGFIVFVTAHAEKLKLTFKYKVEAMDYLGKDNISLESSICDCVKNAYTKYTNISIQGMGTFAVKQPGGMYIYLECAKIFYFQTSPTAKHKIDIYAINQNIEFYGTLNETEKQLNEDFFRCHNSYIVNTKMILRFDKAQMILCLQDDYECPVSSKYVRKLLKRLPAAQIKTY